MVSEPVQQRAGEALRTEHLGPLIERQVGGDQDGALLVALAEDLKEQFRSGERQGDEAQFVNDQQAEAGQIPLQVEQPPLVPGRHRLMHQGGGEAHRHALLAGGLSLRLRSSPPNQLRRISKAMLEGQR